jgi:hypothetical protein
VRTCLGAGLDVQMIRRERHNVREVDLERCDVRSEASLSRLDKVTVYVA